MEQKGGLYGYKKVMAELEDKKKTMIIPMNFDMHWTVIVRVYNETKWIINHADSMRSDGTRAKRIQSVLHKSLVYNNEWDDWCEVPSIPQVEMECGA